MRWPWQWSDARIERRRWRQSVDRWLKYHGMPRPGGLLGYSAFVGQDIDWDHPERYRLVAVEGRRP